jgi:hypothetical protein
MPSNVPTRIFFPRDLPVKARYRDPYSSNIQPLSPKFIPTKLRFIERFIVLDVFYHKTMLTSGALQCPRYTALSQRHPMTPANLASILLQLGVPDRLMDFGRCFANTRADFGVLTVMEKPLIPLLKVGLAFPLPT